MAYKNNRTESGRETCLLESPFRPGRRTWIPGRDLGDQPELDLNALILDQVRVQERTQVSREVQTKSDLAPDLQPFCGHSDPLTSLLRTLFSHTAKALAQEHS